MKKLVFGNWERISKREAQKRYESGEEILFSPVNMHLDGVWSSVVILSHENAEGTFEQVVNNCMYYNCTHETGKYLAYYKHRN